MRILVVLVLSALVLAPTAVAQDQQGSTAATAATAQPQDPSKVIAQTDDDEPKGSHGGKDDDKVARSDTEKKPWWKFW